MADLINKFILGEKNNEFLKKETVGYYSWEYYSVYAKEYDRENTGFINVLKNDLDIPKERPFLYPAKEKAKNTLIEVIPCIMKAENIKECTCVSVPRAKKYETYRENQLYLIDAISEACQALDGVKDGTKIIIRHTNTRTNHLKSTTIRATKDSENNSDSGVNDGDKAYVGITRQTCYIDEKKIIGQTIILVDDIYTLKCNVDEDCIQTMYNMGAKRVIFYAFGYTKRGTYDFF